MKRDFQEQGLLCRNESFVITGGTHNHCMLIVFSGMLDDGNTLNSINLYADSSYVCWYILYMSIEPWV
jgi:hypothetical protein